MCENCDESLTYVYAASSQKHIAPLSQKSNSLRFYLRFLFNSIFLIPRRSTSHDSSLDRVQSFMSKSFNSSSRPSRSSSRKRSSLIGPACSSSIARAEAPSSDVPFSAGVSFLVGSDCRSFSNRSSVAMVPVPSTWN